MGNAGSAPEQASKEKEDAEVRRPPPSTVRFYPNSDQPKARQPPPIKLEEEDVPLPPSADEEMAPRNLWQVYAVGALIVLRWAWVKWKESKDRDDSPDGRSPDESS